MLVLDSFRGKLMANLKWTLCDGKTNFMMIPGRQISVLQLLNVVLNKPFKYTVCEFYNEWMLDDNPTTATGCLWRPPLPTVCGSVLSCQHGNSTPKRWCENFFLMQHQQHAGRHRGLHTVGHGQRELVVIQLKSEWLGWLSVMLAHF